MRRRARRAAALAVAALALAADVSSAAASETPPSPGPTPAPTMVVLPWASDPATADGVTGEVRDITGEVRDIVVSVESVDGSIGVAEGGPDTTVTVAADVLFAFDKADLTAAARAKLAEAAQEVRARRATGTVVVGGHADAKGSAAYNTRLSLRRAEAVTAALEPLLAGLPVTLTAKGYGSTRPVAPNTKPDGSDNPAGRTRNRRVTVTFTPSG